MKKTNIKIPAGLSPAARVWWGKITDEYGITDAAGLLLLQNAMEAFDRMNQASDLIKKYGTLTFDRFKQLRANPACTIERDSRAAMLKALKDLNLDLEPLKNAAGRPTQT